MDPSAIQSLAKDEKVVYEWIDVSDVSSLPANGAVSTAPHTVQVLYIEELLDCVHEP